MMGENSLDRMIYQGAILNGAAPSAHCKVLTPGQAPGPCSGHVIFQRPRAPRARHCSIGAAASVDFDV